MFMALPLQALDQRIAVRSLDRLLTSRIDWRNHHHIGIIETGAEISKQVFQPRIAMRLNNSDDPLFRGTAGRLQNSLDFNRVMGVIVIDGHTVPCPR